MDTTIKELSQNSKNVGVIKKGFTAGLTYGLNKGFLRISEEIYIAIIITLVAFLGFGLGRLSMKEEGVKRAPVKLVETPTIATGAQVSSAVSSKQVDVNSSQSAQTAVVASKQGTKYHYLWCPGASKIVEANKITFASETEAQNAGYTKASNCK